VYKIVGKGFQRSYLTFLMEETPIGEQLEYELLNNSNKAISRGGGTLLHLRKAYLWCEKGVFVMWETALL